MAITNFISEIWASELLSSLKASLVYAQAPVVNRNYEGLIANQGDTVRITSISRPTVSDYVAGSTTITPEPLTDDQRNLVIDQAKYFAFEVDDVNDRQAAGPIMPEGMAEAAYALAEVADTFVSSAYTAVQAANQVGARTITTADDAYVGIVDLGTKLHEANVPMGSGWWVVIPPWYHALLLQDQRFTDASARGTGDSAAVNGMVGRVAGLNVLMSNTVPSTGGTAPASVIIAGYRGAYSYAEQINKTEAYRPESAFSDAVKGLHLYGGKLVRPDGWATLQATEG